MPTKKKRVGFIPREKVMNIINKLSFENNLSNSKIVNMLVEEALYKRGIYDIQTGTELNHVNRKSDILLNHLKNKSEGKNQSHKSSLDINKETSQDIFYRDKNNSFNLETYEKFKLFLKFQEMISNENN